MKLTEIGLKEERSLWLDAGYHLPQFDHETMVKHTKANPHWLHFGAGNIFRAFQANVAQNLLNDGTLDRGIIAVGGSEAMEKLFHPHDNYTVLVTLKADGTLSKTVVGSLAETLTMDTGYENDLLRLREIFSKDSLQMVSFTITEKGYSLTDSNGEYTEKVMADFENGPSAPLSYMGRIASFLYSRYLSGKKPIAMASMDNCSHNGDILRDAVLTFAKKWVADGKTDAGFLEYLTDREKVSFPWSMLDKITPRPDSQVEALLKEDHIENLEPIVTKRNTFIAPFVNAEECQYLVIEDWFPNGRPVLEKGGVLFTDRATVDKVEKMKVCTCLNPLHTVLAVFGCLLGFQRICDEMKDPTLKKLVETIGYKEGLPVVTDPVILHPEDFIKDVLTVRLPNPFMPDTPQRIATDTSQKVAIRFGETIKAYAASDELNVADLKLIPLVLAGWMRYLMGMDDNGMPMECSSDPILPLIEPKRNLLSFGNIEKMDEVFAPLFETDTYFGLNLSEVGMEHLVKHYFAEMMAGPGAVRATLEKYVGK